VTVTEKALWFAQASRGERWLVGVSGGADSVGLLHLLVAEGFKELVVCHLDHGLRGEASAGDAEFVKELASQMGLVCEVGRADVAGRMAQRGESLETAARGLRHNFFAECVGKFGTQTVLLAHHADDQAETVLWNLLRGSNGWKGMREVQVLVTESGVELEVQRPLLALRREEIRAWLVARGIGWREDASNLEPIGIRNRLRNEIFPSLREIAGRDAVAAFARAAGDAAEAEALEDWALEQARVRDPQGRLHLAVLRSLPVVVQRIALRRFLLDQGIRGVDRRLLERGLALLEVEHAASVNLPGGARLRRREGRMWVEL
jgi:tRNA(Ile)-lysidine synthase